MSINRYDSITGELVTLASGQRIWVGTKIAHDSAVTNNKIPNNCLVCITDDYNYQDIQDLSSTIVLPDTHMSRGDCLAYRKGDELTIRLGWVSGTYLVETGATFAYLPFPSGYKRILTEGSGVIYSNNGTVNNAYYVNNYNGRIEFRYRASKEHSDGGYLYITLWLEREE